MDEYFEEKIQEVREDYWNQIREIRAEKEVLRKERDEWKDKAQGKIEHKIKELYIACANVVRLEKEKEVLRKERDEMKHRVKNLESRLLYHGLLPPLPIGLKEE